jgi:hypothetical protein
VQLVQLLQLADKHDVGRVVYAASAALSSSIPTEALEWETALAIYSLPPGCPELDTYKPVYKAAAARVQQEFKDLEVVWQQQHTQQRLLALPHGALLDLLRSDTLRVATENTVAFTIQAWADHQQQQHQLQQYQQQQQQQEQRQQQQQPNDASQQQLLPTQPPQQQLQQQQQDGVEDTDQQQQRYPSLEQRQQLAQQIRMQHCSQLYISTVMVHMPALVHCFTAAEWLHASALAQRTSGNPHCSECFSQLGHTSPCYNCGRNSAHSMQTDLLLAGETAARFPAWSKPARLSSVLQQLIIRWKLPAAELAACLDGVLQQIVAHSLLSGPTAVWAGRCFGVAAGAYAKHGEDGRIAVIGAALQGPRSSVCSINVQISAAQRSDGDQVGALVRLVQTQAELRANHNARMFPDALAAVGRVSSGLELERKLREQQLVHADGCLHLELQLSSPAVM